MEQSSYNKAINAFRFLKLYLNVMHDYQPLDEYPLNILSKIIDIKNWILENATDTNPKAILNQTIAVAWIDKQLLFKNKFNKVLKVDYNKDMGICYWT